ALADLPDRARDIARRGNNRPLEPVGVASAEILHVAVEGADHPAFERRVVDPNEAGPAARHEKMNVGAFVVHVGDAVLRLIVLDPGARQFRAAPVAVAPGVALARLRLAED